MMPVIPHLANECLLKLDYTKTTKWPEIEKKYLNKEEYEIVIQVNGKKRGAITIDKNKDENEIIDKIKELKIIEKYFKMGTLIKTIYVKNRLINFIIK